MQEDFLHYVWKFQKFLKTQLKTTSGEDVEISHQGIHNFDSGPDFFNAKIKIGNQLWAGNVEIHIRSSDWYAHHHETDSAYDAVILHVVWQDDVEIYRKDNSILPTIILKDKIEDSIFKGYQKLFAKNKKWINCEDSFSEVDDFMLQNWLERLYFERLENKSNVVFQLLERSKNDWEAVLFQLLTKNFGLKVNGDSFLSLATSFDFNVVRKLWNNQEDLEALFFGQVGLLDEEIEDAYHKNLQSNYSYIKTKFQLSNSETIPLKFFRLRPVNFPTIRLAQLAAVYANEHQLFSKIIEAKTKDEIYQLFTCETTDFWDTHYHFKSISPKRKKKLTSSFIDLIIINTVAIVKFCYAKEQGKDKTDEIIRLLSSVSAEENSIIQKFNDLKPIAKNVLQSQALLQLKKNYCEKNKCLQCSVGNALLQNN